MILLWGLKVNILLSRSSAEDGKEGEREGGEEGGGEEEREGYIYIYIGREKGWNSDCVNHLEVRPWDIVLPVARLACKAELASSISPDDRHR